MRSGEDQRIVCTVDERSIDGRQDGLRRQAYVSSNGTAGHFFRSQASPTCVCFRLDHSLVLPGKTALNPSAPIHQVDHVEAGRTGMIWHTSD